VGKALAEPVAHFLNRP